MRIRSDGEVPRDHPSMFGEDLVTDPMISDVVEMGETLFLGELT